MLLVNPKWAASFCVFALCTLTRVPALSKCFSLSSERMGSKTSWQNNLGMLSCEWDTTESRSSRLLIQNSCTNSKIGLHKQERAHLLPEQQHKPWTNFLKVWVVSSISHLERSTTNGEKPWSVCLTSFLCRVNTWMAFILRPSIFTKDGYNMTFLLLHL